MTKVLVMWSNFLCQALSFNDKLLQICKVEQFVIGSHCKIAPHCPASFVNFTGRGKAGFLRGWTGQSVFPRVFLAYGRADERTKVFQEVLADLKSI